MVYSEKHFKVKTNFQFLYSLTLLITTLISIGCPALYPLERPTPYAPDYSPECELLVPGHKNSGHESLPLSAGLQYIGNYIPRY